MSDHKISQMRVHRILIPGKAVHSHGIGDVAGIHTVILELITDTGLTGWGEAATWPAFTGTAEAAVAALHVYLRPHVIGADPVQVEPLMKTAEAAIVGHPEAKAALEMALLDLTGKICGLSVAELVGGRMREDMGLSFSVANPDFGKDIEDVAELWADGVRIFKIKTGFRGHAFDLMRLEKLRETYGFDADLRIDYNQGLTAFDAVRHIRDLETFRPTFVEQPVKMHEREVLAHIAHVIETPIMADESVFNARDALYGVQIRMADIFSLKVFKSGGIRRALDVAAIARAAGVEVYGGCMFETGLGHAAGAHLMAALPDLRLDCEFYMSRYYATEDILTDPFPVAHGRVQVPTGPGLGVTVDPAMLDKYRQDPVLG